jgi:PTH1 family peptidyl-tRNA hydrolase
MIKLIVGLGNPGKDHEGDRHNAGADFVNLLAHKHQITLNADKKYFGQTGKISCRGKEVQLLIPTTYMNLSGKAVAAISRFFKIAPEDILVCHDELDFPPGEIRLKAGGGHGGHNGLRDIISALGNNRNFVRLRIGIGHPGKTHEVADYVLKRPSKTEANLIEQAIEKACQLSDEIIAGDLESAMRQLHSKTSS